MADPAGGIEVMRSRIQRASRKPPPTRRPQTTPAAAPPAPDAAPAVVDTQPLPPDDAVVDSTPAAPVPVARRRGVRPARKSDGARIPADAPAVNLAIRVRRPLDDRLADLIHELRGLGVRTSKVELVELLLWELPADETAAGELMERLRRFRARAARQGGELPERS